MFLWVFKTPWQERQSLRSGATAVVVFVGRFAAEGLLSGFCVDTGFVGILGFNFWIPGRFLIGFGCGFP